MKSVTIKSIQTGGMMQKLTKEYLKIVRAFAKSDVPKWVTNFLDEQVNDIAATPLPSNKCIKVTIEYSDIPEKENK